LQVNDVIVNASFMTRSVDGENGELTKYLYFYLSTHVEYFAHH